MAIYINGKKVAGVGMPGKDGKSAYQLAVEGGYQGTEEEFSQILANGGLPSGGTTGQMLYQGESGAEWGDKPVMCVNVSGTETLTADKTAKEIYEAILKGYIVYADVAAMDDVHAEFQLRQALHLEDTYTIVFSAFDGDLISWLYVTTNSSGETVQSIPQELSLRASNVSFTPGTTGLTAENVQDAIEEVSANVGSTMQLDYSKMKSLHELGITDLNDVTEPGTYVGMSGHNYPAISNMPPGLVLPVFVMNVYSFVGPDNTAFAGYRMILQEFFSFGDAIESVYRKFYRAGYYDGEILVFPGDGWQLQSSAAFTSFQPTVNIASDNVQDAIEELAAKKPVMYVTFTPGSGDYITPSKSGDEIYQAVQNGYAVFAVVGDGMQTLIPLQHCAPHTAMFFSITSEMVLIAINISETLGIYMTSNLLEAVAPKRVTVTLPASGWSSNAQTVTVSGVLADETKQLIQPMPAIASQNAYITAGVICSGQAANSLTFTCQTVPTENLTVYVVIQEVSA